MTSHDIRPGEVAADLPEPSDAVLRFIGHIETPFLTRADCPRQGRFDGPECTLVLDQVWIKALKGLEQFDKAEVLYWLHQSRRDLVLQSPRSNGETRGTLSLCSPVRPNPIGLSKVRLLRIDGNRITVRGLDCLNGTPLVDIKPDRDRFTVQAPDKSGVSS